MRPPGASVCRHQPGGREPRQETRRGCSWFLSAWSTRGA